MAGAYSDILNYDPWVNPGSEVLAWSMITRSGDHSVWAQVGWWEQANDTRYTFRQYTTSPNNWLTRFWTAKPEGTYTRYSVIKGGSTFIFSVGGTVYETVTATFTPTEAQVAAEIHTLASQMPGGYSSGAKEYFENTNVSFGSGWIAFNGSPLAVNTTYHGQGTLGIYRYYTWDKACST